MNNSGQASVFADDIIDQPLNSRRVADIERAILYARTERPQLVEMGRSFGYTGGHLHKNWGDESVRRLVTNAILWTAQVEVPAGGAKADLDPADLNRNLDDKRKKK